MAPLTPKDMTDGGLKTSSPTSPTTCPRNLIQTLLSTPGLRIERIVSLGHRSPEGFWYDEESYQ